VTERRVIDVDPALLRADADMARHAAEQTWIHIEAEYDGRIPQLMATLVADGPYAYTIQPEINPDGTVRAPILTTREEIRGAYEQVRGASELLRSEPMVEIRGTWFTFHEAVSTGRPRGSTEPPGRGAETIALFPVSTSTGITGELVWPRVPRDVLGRGEPPSDAPSEPREIRRAALALHDRYLDALRVSDVDAMLDTLNDDVTAAVRDYVDDTGTLIELRGKDAHRSYYRAFFEKFDVHSVDMLDRVVQDWYVFAELRLTVRDDDKRTTSFNVAEFVVMAKDGRFIVRVGHGTDPCSRTNEENE
jgi:ketosteroid isomerase-like protein